MQLLARDTDQLGQPGLDVHVHVFQGHRPGEVAPLDILADVIEPGDDGIAFRLAQHADLGQHGCMGNGTLDVMLVQALVETHRSAEGLDEGVGRFGKTPGPGLVAILVAAHRSDCAVLTQQGAQYRPTPPAPARRARRGGGIKAMMC